MRGGVVDDIPGIVRDVYKKGVDDGTLAAKVGTAGAAQVLAGYTFTNKDSIGIDGSMNNKANWNTTTSNKGKVTIPEGYHNGSGYVDCDGAYNKGMTDADARANTGSTNYKTGYNAGVAATQKGTAGAAQVLTGYTFTNASSVAASGSMKNNGATGGTINPGGSYTIPAGYTSGGTVKANANQNSGTYTYPANSTGGTVDMGVNNTYRYVNAGNVYAKGKADGQAGSLVLSGTIKSGTVVHNASQNFNVNTGVTDPKIVLIQTDTVPSKQWAVAMLWVKGKGVVANVKGGGDAGALTVSGSTITGRPGGMVADSSITSRWWAIN